jgi:putative aldouronate transport system substrate-binding protein
VVGLLAVACVFASGSSAGSGASGAAASTSQRVNLVLYQVGDPPNDIAAVQDKINEILLSKINATLTVNFSTWTDWITKYNMVLASGEPCDLIYTANWMSYAALANNDAFVPLDKLLPQYAPELWNLIPQGSWNQMRVKGNIYSVPLSAGEYGMGGVMYREDLRAKYNLPVPDSLENIEAYAAGIKRNEPNQQIFGDAVTTGNFGILYGTPAVFSFKYSWVYPDPVYGIVANYNTPSESYDYWKTQDFRDDMKLMKRWADLGFWSRSALSESNDADVFNSGKSVIAVGGMNPAKYIGAVNGFAETHPDWKVGYAMYARKNGVAYANSPIANGTAIPVNSRYPERAAMALNLLYTDKTLNQLIMYGIAGTHYTINANGYYVKGPKGDDYGYEGANTWNLRNPNFQIPQESDKALNAVFDELHTLALKTKTPDVDIYSGFMENYEPYSAERAALSTVLVQYLAPIQAGLVSDVDAAIDEFLQKARAAGLDRIQQEYSKQWKAYCEQYGYK